MMSQTNYLDRGVRESASSAVVTSLSLSGRRGVELGEGTIGGRGRSRRLLGGRLLRGRLLSWRCLSGAVDCEGLI